MDIQRNRPARPRPSAEDEERVTTTPVPASTEVPSTRRRRMGTATEATARPARALADAPVDEAIVLARAELSARLNRLDFVRDPRPSDGAVVGMADGLGHLERQARMQEEYLDWAARIVAARHAQFGSDPRGAHPAGFRSSLQHTLPTMLFDSFVAGVKSSFRSPVRSAVSQAITSELSIAYDATVTSGAVSGISAWTAAEVVVPAIQSRARLSNMPELKPLDPALCFPDPGPVALRFEKGSDGSVLKEFYRPIEADETEEQLATAHRAGYPSRAELTVAARGQRHRLALWQDSLSGKQFGTLNKPIASGALQALRRAASTDSMLLTASGIFAGSLGASFAASGLTEFIQSMLKTTLLSDVAVDDLAGGSERLNTFRLVRPDPRADPPGFADLANVPGVASDAMREMAALMRHALLPDGRATSDIVPRSRWNITATAAQLLGTVTANVFASVAGNATGPFFAEIVKRPAADNLSPADFQRSREMIFAQFASSGINELVWGHMSSGSAFGRPSLQQHQALQNFRDGVKMTRRRKIADNLQAIEAQQQRQAELEQRGLATQAHHSQWLESRFRVRALEKENQQLARLMKQAEDWQTKTPTQRSSPIGAASSISPMQGGESA